MKIFMLVNRFLRKYISLFSLFVILSVVALILYITIPHITGKYVDLLIQVKSKSSIITLIITLSTVLLLDIIVSFSKNIIEARLKNKLAFELNFDIVEHLKRMPLSYFGGVNTAYLTKRIYSDAYNVSGFVLENAASAFVHAATLLVILCYVFYINRAVGVCILLLLPLYILISFLFRDSLDKKEYKYKEKRNHFFSTLNEQMDKIKLIKINFINLLIFLFCGYKVMENQMTPGEFIVMNLYFSMVIHCLNFFLGFGKAYQNALISYVRLKEITDLELEPNGSKIIVEINEIEFKNVYFSFDNSRYIVKNFNYKFKKGNIYGITGRQGAGKTTLIDLMIGLIHSCRGEILFNSTSIRELDLYSLRKRLIGVSEQEPSLLDDTIINNTIYGLKSFSMKDVIEYCKCLNAYRAVSNLPQGFDTNVSGVRECIPGEEQRKFTRIREFLKESDVLIFDEPVSAMDADSISTFKSLLGGIKQDKIIIIVTQQENMDHLADEVIRFYPTENISDSYHGIA